MKRLFLASSGLTYIKTFVKRDPHDLKMLFIPTAGNLDEDIWWIDKDRDVLNEMGFQIAELDIEHASHSEMDNLLKGADIVFIAGGNTFFLLKQLRESGFDALLTDYVDRGGMYAGASAGALIAGNDISPIAPVDEPERVSDLESTIGLNLVDFIPIPHYDMNDRAEAIDIIKEEYGDMYTIMPLTDDEAIVVEDDTWRVVQSKRTDHELAWFAKNLS